MNSTRGGMLLKTSNFLLPFFTIHCLIVNKLQDIPEKIQQQYKAENTRVCGITYSVSARRWEGNGFVVRPKPRHSYSR